MTDVVSFVLGDVRFDSRVLREAQALSSSGLSVVVIGRTVDPFAAEAERVMIDGVAVIRVPVASGVLRWVHLLRRPKRGLATILNEVRHDPLRLAPRVTVLLLALIPLSVLALVAVGGAALTRVTPRAQAISRILRWELSWRLAVRPWAAAAAAASRREAPMARLFWAHDLRAVPAAIAAREGRTSGAIVYDAHEIFQEAGDTALLPGWAKRRIGRLERRLVASAAAVVTVNDQLRDYLARHLEPVEIVVARNCPRRWEPGPDSYAQSPLRRAVELEPDVPIVLYHGGLAPGRGIETLVAALSEPGLEAVHLVFMGSGPSRAWILERAGRPLARIHLLDPVPPSDLPVWVVGADLVAALIEPTTLNHRLSSPNKMFEGLAAGVPVVGSDLPGISSVILSDPGAPLGAVVDPVDRPAVAMAIRTIISLPPAERDALRARCLDAAHERWNWEREASGLTQLAHRLVDDARSGPGADPPRRRDHDARPGAQRVDGAVRQHACFILASTGEFDARTRRLAGDLSDRGHVVTIIARAGPGLPNAEAWSPSIRLIRVDAGSPHGRPRSRFRAGPLRLAFEAARIAGVVNQVRQQQAAVATLDVRPDLVHAMGFLALPVARDLARRQNARLVYDARDLYVESNNIARLPRPLRDLFSWQERRWARSAAMVMTVNASCAAYLERRLRIPRPVVVMNGQRPWDVPVPRPDLLRATLGLAPGRKIALYHGGLMPDRGLPQLITACARAALDDVDLVIMGSGVMEPTLRRLAAESLAPGRIHFLPPVSPDALLSWVASADIGVMPNQPTTLNERLSTPNKLFECLTAGTPVVSSDFPERRNIIAEGPDGSLGELCDPTDPASIAGAIRAVLDRDLVEAAALRDRCRRAAAGRFGWKAQFDAALDAYAGATGQPW